MVSDGDSECVGDFVAVLVAVADAVRVAVTSDAATVIVFEPLSVWLSLKLLLPELDCEPVVTVTERDVVPVPESDVVRDIVSVSDIDVAADGDSECVGDFVAVLVAVADSVRVAVASDADSVIVFEPLSVWLSLKLLLPVLD